MGWWDGPWDGHGGYGSTYDNVCTDDGYGRTHDDNGCTNDYVCTDVGYGRTHDDNGCTNDYAEGDENGNSDGAQSCRLWDDAASRDGLWDGDVIWVSAAGRMDSSSSPWPSSPWASVAGQASFFVH